MEMVLKTVYRIHAIPIIQSFVVETAKFFGANTAECKALKLASEEAAEHIILNYPQGQEGQFEIFCMEEKGVFKVVFSNMGLPVDKENIPYYKVENPEESIEGLKFFLIRKLTDNFYFLNKGTDGWQTVLEKKIAALANADTNDETVKMKATVVAKKAGEKLSIGFATPEDAYNITRLAYLTYRYSYVKTIFYYPEMLKEAIENKTVISFTAKNSENEIVIHSAYLRSHLCREIVEAGALMSNPDYRQNSDLIRLLKKQSKFAAEEATDIDIVEANLVTAHTGSQRITSMFSFSPFALKLSVHNRSRFVAMKIDSQRETLLYSVWAPHGLDEFNLTIPDVHREIVSDIFTEAGLSATIKNDVSQPALSAGKYSIEKNTSDEVATIRIEEPGIQWMQELKHLIRELSTENIITFYLKIPAWNPLLPELDEKLASLGFFFSGILARTPEKWMLLYTRIDRQKLDYSKIRLFDDRANKLKNYIQSCYEKLMNI
ncbi:MAG: ATP-binding protein [Acidobacteria bacterium]|nr:ATP-binding protein [Acidobacteriota bacterium]